MDHVPPTATDDIDIGALWRAVVDRRALLLLLTLGAGVLTYVGLTFVTPLYSSQARILIEHDEPAFLRPRSETGNTDRRVFLEPEAVASQVQVLLSRDLAYQVVKELKLEDDPEFNTVSGLRSVLTAIGLLDAPSVARREDRAIETFERRLSVYLVSKSRVIVIEFSSWKADLAAEAANRLARAYIVWQQQEKLKQNKDASQWLNEQIKTLRKRVAESEEKVERFRSSTGLYSGTNNVTLDAQQLSELNSQLILAKAQRTEAEARADLIRRMLKEKGDVATAPDVLKSNLIQRLLEQRVRVRRELAELSATLLSSHPRIRQLHSELADLSRQIRQEADKIVTGLENEAQIAGARETSLRASLDELKRKSGKASDDQIRLRALEREAKANRDLLESYLARYREANARRDASSVPAHASIISRAHAANKPSFPKKGPISALVAAAVGLLSLAWIVARELVSGAYMQGQPRVARVPVERVSDTPALRPVPQAARPRARGPVKARSARSAARIVTAKCTGGFAHNVIVTGATHHENTAPDALDIARAIAASGVEVAIVDLSSGGLGIAGLAGLSPGPGLAELLDGSARFEDVVRAEPHGTLQIIPTGRLSMEAFSGEHADRWNRIHNALRQTYDCVVLHTSQSAARRLLHGMADGPVSVVLVTGKRSQAYLAPQVAEQLSAGGEIAVEIVLYEGGGAAAGTAGKAAFWKKAAAV